MPNLVFIWSQTLSFGVRLYRLTTIKGRNSLGSGFIINKCTHEEMNPKSYYDDKA